MDMPETDPTYQVLGGALALLGMFLSGLVTAAVAYGTYQDLIGRKASLIECLGRGLPLIFRVVGVTIVYSLAVGLGSLLLVIPGLIVLTMYAVAVPVAVVERLGVFASLSRSAELTDGYRWRVLGTIFLAVILVFLIVAVFGMVFAMAVIAATDFSDSAASAEGVALVGFVVDAAATAFWAVIVAVTYNELRTAREGADVGQIAAVFD